MIDRNTAQRLAFLAALTLGGVTTTGCTMAEAQDNLQRGANAAATADSFLKTADSVRQTAQPFAGTAEAIWDKAQEEGQRLLGTPVAEPEE